MKTIQLTKGYKTLIDDEDYEMLNQYKWCFNSGYAVRGVVVNSKTIFKRMHRIIMNPPSDMFIDHINGDGLDNQRKNLRICTHAQNCQNKRITKGLTSKYRGVALKARDKKWQVYVTANGKRKYLGYFETELEAAIIYNIAARKYYGEFARPNKLIKISY